MSVSLSLLASTALACASGACALIPQHEPSKAFNNIPENYVGRVMNLGDPYSVNANGSIHASGYLLVGDDIGVYNVSPFPHPYVYQKTGSSGWYVSFGNSGPQGTQYHVIFNDVAYSLSSPGFLVNGVYPEITSNSFGFTTDYCAGPYESIPEVYFSAIYDPDEATLTATTYNPFRDGTSWVDNIGVGFGIIPNLGTAINTGLDSMFYTDGVISKTATFAFTLMGIGISVGVVSLVFKWLTGRHGM